MTVEASMSITNDEGAAGRTCSLTVLNRSGDSTLAWDASNDAVMREVIQAKLDQGFAFFVLRRRLGGLLPDRRERVTDIEAAMASRRLVMADDALASVVGKDVHLVASPAREPLRDGDAVQSRDAGLIARSQSYAVAPMAGG